MSTYRSKNSPARGLWLVLTGIVLLFAIFTPVASATPGRIIFSINGDTTLTTEVQGDTVYWGSTCIVGDSMRWEIWLDINADGVLDDPGDKLILQYSAIDGDTSSNKGPADISATPDGNYQTAPMILGIAPGHYIFQVESMTSHAKLQKAVACTALPSPPNTFSGTVTMPGHAAPDSMLKNLWIEAGGESARDQIWTGFTDSTGAFTINVGSQGTDEVFRISPPDLPGLVSPERVYDTASGHKSGLLFAYGAPSDSLYGRVVDEKDSLIKTTLSVYCMPNGGGSQKSVDINDGVYVLPFAANELGEWNGGVSTDGLNPGHLTPANFIFNNSVQHSINHDFVCPTADTVLFARVTENGNHPTHHYLIQAMHDSLGFQTQAVSDTGASNVLTLHISKHYSNDWSLTVQTWDTSYAIPQGYVVPSNPHHLKPGDTADINFVSGKFVQDSLKLDMDDVIPTLDSVWVSLSGNGQFYAVHPDNQGVYKIYADTGVYQLNVNCPGYMTLPSSPYTLHLTKDTIGGLGFTFNQITCKVTGTLSNVPLPISGVVSVQAHTGSGGNGHYVNGNVNSATGEYILWVCDGSWTLDPPSIPNRQTPSSSELTITNVPDTARVADFAYSALAGVNDNDPSGLPKVYALKQNYPNPFNPTTKISYELPAASRVELSIYDVLGRVVTILVNDTKAAGRYSATWDGTDSRGQSVASGIYFYRITAGTYVEARKMILLK